MRPVWRIASSCSPVSSTRSKRAIADAGDLVGPGAARDVHADLRRGAVLGLVPFGRQRDQLAVAIAGGDVGQHDLRQGPGLMQLLAAALDLAVVGELAQHVLERDAVGILHAERARDLARADFAGLLADEGKKVVFGGKGRFGLWTFHENAIREKNSPAHLHRHDHARFARWRSLVDHSAVHLAFTLAHHLATLALRAGFFSATTRGFGAAFAFAGALRAVLRGLAVSPRHRCCVP